MTMGPRRDCVGAELKGLVQDATASGTRSAEITQEILIGEVEIISMLIPSPPSTSKTLAATPGGIACRRRRSRPCRSARRCGRPG